MKSLSYTIVILVLATTCACSRSPSERSVDNTLASTETNAGFLVETVFGGLQVPWSIVWAPDGRMIFTERPGRVRVVENGKLLEQPLFVVPDVEPTGESGLMSVALHPQFADNHFLYLSYAYGGNGVLVRVARYRETPSSLVDRKVIIENIPAAQFHAGAVESALVPMASCTSQPEMQRSVNLLNNSSHLRARHFV